jgi:excisionase family DNA binding protein
MSDKWVTCADEITIRIKDGRYPAGQWLPSLQRLADDLGVSRGPVTEALTHLREQGVIIHVKGKGYHPDGEPPRGEPPRKRRAVTQRTPDEVSSLLTVPYVTVTELASALRVSKMTVHRAIKAGLITGVVRVSARTIRIPPDGVRGFIADCCVKETDT